MTKHYQLLGFKGHNLSSALIFLRQCDISAEVAILPSTFSFFSLRFRLFLNSRLKLRLFFSMRRENGKNNNTAINLQPPTLLPSLYFFNVHPSFHWVLSFFLLRHWGRAVRKKSEISSGSSSSSFIFSPGESFPYGCCWCASIDSFHSWTNEISTAELKVGRREAAAEEELKKG